MSLRLLGVAILCMGGSLGTWAQDRDRAPHTRPARLSGRVVAADTGRPIGRAQVSLMRSSDARPSLFAATNDAGIFSFDEVPEGRYIITASKHGLYLEKHYGETAPDVPPKLVTVAPDSVIEIEIILQRASAISGRIFDETGEPLPYATVTLSHPPAGPKPSAPLHSNAPRITMSTASGFVRFATLSGAMTNDRGEFRLFGIAPGEYMLYATTHALQGEKRRYAPIYYPGVLDAASAQHLQVLPGQDIANVDFTFRLITTVTVSGIALLPDGQPMPGGALALYGAAGAGELTQVGSVRTDGSFSVVAIPGQYVLRARHSSFPGAASGAGRVNFSVAQPLTVGTEDISGLVLKVTQGATLSGRMTFEGTAAPESLWGFSLTVDSGGPGEVVTGKPDPTGAVVVRGIESGARRVRASVPKGWMLKSIYVDGRDVADVPIEFRDDTTVSSVNVVFTDSLTRLHVRVRYPQSENSSIVVVFPDDSSLASDRRVAVRAASKDLLTIEALPPGEYLVVALSDASMKGLQQPGDALQKRLRPLAQRVQILDAAAVTITLNAVPVPR